MAPASGAAAVGAAAAGAYYAPGYYGPGYYAPRCGYYPYDRATRTGATVLAPVR
jgi:hypothetical protein